MNTRRDSDHVIATWLQGEAPDRAPERLLTASRDRIGMTRQRRAWWPARRLHEMNSPLKFALAAAAVVVVALIGINLLPRQAGIGGPDTSPSLNPAPSPSPSSPASSPASASPMPYVEPTFLAAGTYVIAPGGGNPGYTFALPEGWESRFVVLWKDRDGPGEVAFGAWTVANVYADSCH
jgi:hypothetical protein